MKFTFTKSTKKIGKGFTFPFGKNPYIDWRILLGVFLILILGILFISSYIFLGVKRGELFLVPAKEGGELQPLDQKHLDNVLKNFQDKEERLKEIEEKGIRASSLN